NVDAVRQGLTSVPGQFEQPELFGHFDLYWVPIYGKASLFDQYILHFEFYGTGGLGIASSLDDDVSPAANFGIGQRTFLNEWFGLRIEARNHWYITNQTVNRIERSDMQSVLLLYVGASFFIPPSFEYSFL
ncbi:MAG: outer membrane beta-barrel domain-containing protein, partial [Myxococcota bacterium]